MTAVAIVLHVKQAAARLGVHPSEVYEFARQYGIRYVRTAGAKYAVAGIHYYFYDDVMELRNWLNKNDRDINDQNDDWPGIPDERESVADDLRYMAKTLNKLASQLNAADVLRVIVRNEAVDGKG